jgi:hypothetical protein
VRRRTTTLVTAAVALGLWTGAAPAAGSAGPNASCVGTITSFEATQLEPGAVGTEVSALATSAPMLGAFVSDLAHAHGGSIGGCAG